MTIANMGVANMTFENMGDFITCCKYDYLQI